MSMKRTKARTSGSRDKNADDSFWNKPVEPERSWQEHVDGKPEEAFAPYSMSSRFAKGQLVAHPKFGKGVIVEVDAGRVEILFESGKKKLGHGQA